VARGKLQLNDLTHLAYRLGTTVRELECLAGHIDQFVKRAELVVGGKRRTITAPRRRLKRVQSAIKNELLAPLPLPGSAHGYRRKRSPITAAVPHVGKPFMLTMDIRSFFPSIHSSRVYRLWRRLECSPDVARVLTLLTTYDHELPLGFPSSPALANLIRGRLDARIEGLCRLIEGMTYTSYSDNLHISGPYISAGLAEAFRRMASEEGLPIPPDRVVVRGPGQSRRMLGLTVNAKVNVTKGYRRRLRAEIDHYLRSNAHDAKRRRSLEGKVRHVHRLNPTQGAKLWRLLAGGRRLAPGQEPMGPGGPG
jgi:RNA-directed DNA polymerase